MTFRGFLYFSGAFLFVVALGLLTGCSEIPRYGNSGTIAANIDLRR